MARVAILGTGSVGQAIAEGLVRMGHEVRFGSRNPAEAKVPPKTVAVSQREAAKWGDVVVLAVPYPATKDTIVAVGADALGEKTLIDATNVIAPSGGLAVGHTTSGAEELARLVPDAKVVKAFNTVFAQHMRTGMIGRDKIALLVAGDDSKAKEVVIGLGKDIGFDAFDAGPLSSARYMEPLAMQMMALAFYQKMGAGIGLKLVRAPK